MAFLHTYCLSDFHFHSCPVEERTFPGVSHKLLLSSLGDIIKVQSLRWENYPGLSEWVQGKKDP